jgi:hypothetical protein
MPFTIPPSVQCSPSISTGGTMAGTAAAARTASTSGRASK